MANDSFLSRKFIYLSFDGKCINKIDGPSCETKNQIEPLECQYVRNSKKSKLS